MPEPTPHPPLTHLSEEEQLFRDTVRDFAGRAVKPRVAAMERASAVDPAVLRQCFEIGLMGVEIPEEYGGAGGSLLMTVLAVEELSAVDASVAICVDVQNTLVNALLLKWASASLKQRYLPRLATDLIGAYALSEPEAGFFVIFANVDFSLGYKGITAFAVERGFRGFSVGKKEDKLGIRASSTCEL